MPFNRSMAMTILKKLKHQISPSSFTDGREYLHSLYAAAKQADSKYSFIKMAEDLGFAPTNIIYQIIEGKRPLTAKTGQKIVAGLGLTGNERRYFLELIQLKSWKNPADRNAALEKLLTFKQTEPHKIAQDMLEYYAQWYHPVIREMTRLEAFQSDPNWIAASIVPRIRPEQAKESLKVLERLTLIRFDEGLKRHLAVESTVFTGHEVSGVGMMNYHTKMIDIAKAALTQSPHNQRDFSVVNICVTERSIPILKAMIHAFQMQLLKFDNECVERERAVQINIQMFPNTKTG